MELLVREGRSPERCSCTSVSDDKKLSCHVRGRSPRIKSKNRGFEAADAWITNLYVLSNCFVSELGGQRTTARLKNFARRVQGWWMMEERRKRERGRYSVGVEVGVMKPCAAPRRPHELKLKILAWGSIRGGLQAAWKQLLWRGSPWFPNKPDAPFAPQMHVMLNPKGSERT